MAAAEMDTRKKLAFLKEHYKKLERESGAREQLLKSRIEDLQSEHERERKAWELQTSEMSAELSKVNTKWREAQQECQMLQQQMESLPQPSPSPAKEVSAMDRMANAFKNIGRTDWEKECGLLKERLEGLETQIEAKDKELASLSAALEEQEAGASEARVALDELQQSTSGQSAAMDARINKIQEEHKKARSQLEDKVDELEAGKERLESWHQAAQQRESRLREDYQEEQHKNSTLRAEKQSLAQELAKLQADSSAQAASLETCNQGLTTKLAEADKELKALQTERAELKTREQQLISENQELLHLQSSSAAAEKADVPTSQPDQASPDNENLHHQLHQILADSKQLSGLRDFARQEDKERYLMFWQDVEDFRELASAVDDAAILGQTADVILSKYLNEDAESHVTIDESVRLKIQQKINDPSTDLSTLFSEAQAKVFEYLRDELYPVYVKEGGIGNKMSTNKVKKKKKRDKP